MRRTGEVSGLLADQERPGAVPDHHLQEALAPTEAWGRPTARATANGATNPAMREGSAC